MIDIFQPDYDTTDCVVVTYALKAKTNLAEASKAIAFGQSIGNPTMRSQWETVELWENFACRILATEASLTSSTIGLVKIAWPKFTLNPIRAGVSQLLCCIAGGLVDIEEILGCHIVNLELPKTNCHPAFGMSGTRKFTDCYDRPLLGGILKPKTGLSLGQMADMVKAMIDGGVNVIKDDEILGCQGILDRMDVLSPILEGTKVIYIACINSDSNHITTVQPWIPNIGVHINVWSGLGTYRAVRQYHKKTFIHFQKSGDRFFTLASNNFCIRWPVLCQIAIWSGVDSIHAGMWGGYLHTPELETLIPYLNAYNVIPFLSCGMTPDKVAPIREKFGNDWLANVGGYIHSYSGGTTAGVQAMRKALDE